MSRDSGRWQLALTPNYHLRVVETSLSLWGGLGNKFLSLAFNWVRVFRRGFLRGRFENDPAQWENSRETLGTDQRILSMQILLTTLGQHKIQLSQVSRAIGEPWEGTFREAFCLATTLRGTGFRSEVNNDNLPMSPGPVGSG